MVIVEKSFPRGGIVSKEAKAAQTKDNIIFGALQKKIKKPKRKTNDGLKNLLQGASEDNIESISAELLSYDTIQDGMNIMAVVKKVDALYVHVSLPGRMTARISALEISEAYTKATQEFVANGLADMENYKTLQQLYSIGQIVYGRVQEVKKREVGGGKEIIMSLKPAEVHAELVHNNVKVGLMLNAAVAEVQEHGYVIESGIRGLRAFMPRDKAQAELSIGELIFLKIEKINKDKAVSTCSCKHISSDAVKLKKQIEPVLDYILPGTIVKFTVNKRLKDGLQGSILNEAFTAYINEHQLAEPLAMPEDYEINATLNARVLYVMPLTKLVYLTLNLNKIAPADEQILESDNEAIHYKRGDVVENARVHHLGTGGVVLVLNNQFKGVISYKTIKNNYKGNYDQDELLAKYAKKTKHKVRILDYDIMDALYICTDDAKVVNETFFSLDDLKAGDFVTAVVKKWNAKLPGYEMQLGKMKGAIEKVYLASSTKPLEAGAKVRCRIVATNAQHRSCLLTNRPEYLHKNCKLLTSMAEAKVNHLYAGTIVKCYDGYVLVKFFNQIKGVLYKKNLDGVVVPELESFYEGQTMQFRILKKTDAELRLALAEHHFSLGEICPVTVLHALDAGLEIKVKFGDEEQQQDVVEVRGLIPMRLLSDFEDLAAAKLRIFEENANLKAVAMGNNTFSLRDLAYFSTHLTKEWKTLQQGDILKASVKHVEGDVVELMLPLRGYSKLVKLHLNMLLVNAYKDSRIMLSPEQVVYVKVLTKQLATKTITATARMTDVWNGDLAVTAQLVQSYLDEVTEIKLAYKKQHKAIAAYSVGEKVQAIFLGVHDDSKDWQFELKNKKKHNKKDDESKQLAVMKATAVGRMKTPEVGTEHECVILWIDYANDVVYVSHKANDLKRICTEKECKTKYAGNVGRKAKVLLKLENLVICALDKGQNPLVYCPRRVHFNDFENSASGLLKEGEVVRLSFIHDTKMIAVLDGTYKLWHNVQKKRQLDEAEADTKAAKRAKLQEQEKTEKLKAAKVTKKSKTSQIANDDEDEIVENTSKKVKQMQTLENADDTLPFYEDTTPDTSEYVRNIVATARKEQQQTPVEKEQATKIEATKLAGIADFWNTDLTQLQRSKEALSSDDDDDEAAGDSQQPAAKRKKLTAVEKFKQQREEETRLRAIEEKYADPNQLPESVDQFDRIVLSDPNNSKHWINYMVFHLQSTEIDKARAVARRAVKTISQRDGVELLNIWLALLNLELRYGSKEAFDDTLKEALTFNDPMKVYMRTLEILVEAKKSQELIEMIAIVTKKFKAQQDVWKAVANAYFSMNMTEKAQQQLHRALASLPEREHVNTIVIFANLNHKYEQNEMAQTLMDQVVTSYPKRVDVWTQYVDMLIKENLVDSARAVLERAIIQKIPLKKMRTIFKKYLEFEERFGTDADVQKVKQLAAEYVKNNSTL